MQNGYPLICDIICANSWSKLREIRIKHKVLETVPNYCSVHPLHAYLHYYVADIAEFTEFHKTLHTQAYM